MNQPNGQAPDYAPRRPALIAGSIYSLTALTLCWPMLLGKFLVGPYSDQFKSGYSYRHFAAEYFQQFGSIPQWNPYIFGGLPYIGAAHGDIFYPTAALRWFLPTDTAMNLGFLVHLVVAGCAMYCLARTLKLTWGGAIVAGLSYQLTGIVASLVFAGHDGKLFVSALAPLLFAAIVWAVRDRARVGYPVIALVTGLALQGHPQTAYYLLLAAAIWGVFWVWSAEGPKGGARYRVIAGAVGAVVLGIGLYAIYALPMAQYVPHSPRAAGGSYTGWANATSFSLPPPELLGTLLPRIYGGPSPTYFGLNQLRFHSEYVGAVVALLALLGIGGRVQRRARLAFATVAVLFLLVALGGHTPFYRLWYAVMPLSSKIRAPGQAFVLVALPLAYWAGRGADRLLRGEASLARLAWGIGIVGGFGLLAAIGLLQPIAEDIARIATAGGASAGRDDAGLALANSGLLRRDGARLLAFAVGGGIAAYWITKKRPNVPVAVLVLATVVWADLWVVARPYFAFSPPAAVTFGPDQIVERVRQTPLPYRVLNARLYPYSWLMAAGVPNLLGHHGNEFRYFDDLLGGQGEWSNLNRSTLDLYAVRFILHDDPGPIPGFHRVLGPVETSMFGTGYLFEADSIPPYARVVAGAVKLPEDQLAPTAADPRFPSDRLAIYPETAALDPEPIRDSVPPPPPLTAQVVDWRPGHMRITIRGQAAEPLYLVVAENWYSDWHATVDSVPVPVLRAQNALLSVVLPAGAKEVVLAFDSKAYRAGRLISGLSLALVIGLFVWALAGGTPPGLAERHRSPTQGSDSAPTSA